MRTFRLEKHEACRCECVQQSSDCNEHQEYRSDECRCMCRDQERSIECLKKPEKMWFQDSCECKCRHPITCTTGTVFSHETCKCHVSQETSQFSFKQFPLIHFHSSIDLEIKKQEEFGSRLGSSGGINPDNFQLPNQQNHVPQQHSFNHFVLQDQASHLPHQEKESNRLSIMPSN